MTIYWNIYSEIDIEFCCDKCNKPVLIGSEFYSDGVWIVHPDCKEEFTARIQQEAKSQCSEKNL